MTVSGIVHEIKGELVLIKCRQSCSTCGGCESGKERLLEVLNKKSYPLKHGDLVEVYISPVKAVKAAFLLLILPLLLFFPFYYICGIIWKAAGEPVKVLAGLGGVACGFLVNLILKRSVKEQEMPEIARVVIEETAGTVSGSF